MSSAVQGTASTSAAKAPRGGRHWWSGLATRERTLVLLMLVAMAGAAAWVGWWEPLAARRVALHERLPTLQAQVDTLDALATARAARRAEAAMDMGQLQAQLRGSGLETHIRTIAQGEQRVLEIQDAPADVLWTLVLPHVAHPGVEIQELTLERTGGEDMAAARVTGRVVVRVDRAETAR